MTAENVAADRAHDAQIAEAQDKAIHVALGFCPHPFESWRKSGPDGDVETICGLCHGDPRTERYSSDPVAFDSLMQEIGKRGLGEKFVTALSRLITEVPFAGSEASWIWDHMSAPQSIRAAACLAVLREAKT